MFLACSPACLHTCLLSVLSFYCGDSIRGVHSGYGSLPPAPTGLSSASHSVDIEDHDAVDGQQQQRGGTQAVSRLVGGVADAEQAVRELVEVSILANSWLVDGTRKTANPRAVWVGCWAPSSFDLARVCTVVSMDYCRKKWLRKLLQSYGSTIRRSGTDCCTRLLRVGTPRNGVTFRGVRDSLTYSCGIMGI